MVEHSSKQDVGSVCEMQPTFNVGVYYILVFFLDKVNNSIFNGKISLIQLAYHKVDNLRRNVILH